MLYLKTNLQIRSYTSYLLNSSRDTFQQNYHRVVLFQFHILIIFFFLFACLGINAFSYSCLNPDQKCSLPKELGVIRIHGKIVESSTKNPFEEAHIIAKSGGIVVASIFSDTEGQFVITIPEEKVVDDRFTLRIKHNAYIFIKENISSDSDGMLIEINGEIFLDDREEYHLPIYRLDHPQVGTVTVWFRNGQPQRILKGL